MKLFNTVDYIDEELVKKKLMKILKILKIPKCNKIIAIDIYHAKSRNVYLLFMKEFIIIIKWRNNNLL